MHGPDSVDSKNDTSSSSNLTQLMDPESKAAHQPKQNQSTWQLASGDLQPLNSSEDEHGTKNGARHQKARSRPQPSWASAPPPAVTSGLHNRSMPGNAVSGTPASQATTRYESSRGQANLGSEPSAAASHSHSQMPSRGRSTERRSNAHAGDVHLNSPAQHTGSTDSLAIPEAAASRPSNIPRESTSGCCDVPCSLDECILLLAVPQSCARRCGPSARRLCTALVSPGGPGPHREPTPTCCARPMIGPRSDPVLP